LIKEDKMRKGINLVLRILVVAMVIATFIGAALPAFASATINEQVSPAPTSALMNDGTGVESIWWKITYDSVALKVIHKIIDPDGHVENTTIYDNITGAPNPDLNLVNEGGQLVIYNNEDFDGSIVGTSGRDLKWLVVAGAKPGAWISRLEYYSVGQGGDDYEQSADQTFYVRQPLTIFKYNDLDGDGLFDVGEPGLGGWDFRITGPGGYDHSGTTVDGAIELIDNDTGALPALKRSGDYTITETPQNGWKNTDPGLPGDPSPYVKTITIPGEVIDNTSPMVRFGNTELSPDTTTNIDSTSKTLPDGGGTVDLTVTEYCDVNGITLDNVSVIVTGGLTDYTLTLAGDPAATGDDNTNGKLDPGETWRWVIHDVYVTGTTTFIANGHGYFGQPPEDVSWDTGHLGERSSVRIDVQPPHQLPGVSSLGIGILVAVLGLLMTLFIYRKTRQVKN
jgi:hypothetical protein